MAKLFGKMEDERGVEIHKIADRRLCANFYYGSREHSIRALTVCEIVDPQGETVAVSVEFVSPKGVVTHQHQETLPLPKRQILAEEVPI